MKREITKFCKCNCNYSKAETRNKLRAITLKQNVFPSLNDIFNESRKKRLNERVHLFRKKLEEN